MAALSMVPNATFFLIGDTGDGGGGELSANQEVRRELGPAPVETHSGRGGGVCHRPSQLWAWNLDFGAIILLSSFI